MQTNRHKNIRYSILELASIAKGSTPGDTFKQCLDLAQQAEESGYHRFWLAEHHNMVSIASAATAVLITHIAGGTKTIRVGSGGIMLPNHSPLIVAEQFGTLGSLFPDRIDLGLGRAPGTDPVTAQSIRSDRMQSVYKFPEEILQIQKYFSKDNAAAQVRASVAEGVEVPIYILGSSTDSAHLAALKGLPYAFASHFAPAQLFEALKIYKAEFKPSDVLQNPYTIACINIVAADTDQQAQMLFTTTLRLMLGVLTSTMDYMQPPTLMTQELLEMSQHPAFRQMLMYAFVGSKETVKQRTIEFLQETDISEVMVASHIYNHEDRLKSYHIFSEIMNEL